jgi:hypothetical protein
MFYRYPETCSGAINTAIKRAVVQVFGIDIPNIKKALYLVWSRSAKCFPGGSLANANILDVNKWDVNAEVGTLWAWIVGYLTGSITEEYAIWQHDKRVTLPGQYFRASPDQMEAF